MGRGDLYGLDLIFDELLFIALLELLIRFGLIAQRVLVGITIMFCILLRPIRRTRGRASTTLALLWFAFHDGYDNLRIGRRVECLIARVTVALIAHSTVPIGSTELAPSTEQEWLLDTSCQPTSPRLGETGLARGGFGAIAHDT